jgi:hypothetical protein
LLPKLFGWCGRRLAMPLKLTDARRAIAGITQHHWQTRHVAKAAEVMVCMLQSVHAVGVIEEARKNHGSAGAATCGCAVRIVEARAVGCQSVEVGLIVRDDEDDVFRRRPSYGIQCEQPCNAEKETHNYLTQRR